MTIGIIAAMDEEIYYLKQEIKEQKQVVIANSLFIEGTLEGHDVVLLKSGIGKVNAAMATTILQERYHPEFVLNTGSAGGLKKGLEIGDIVISSDVLHHDVDATVFGYEYGQVPGMPPTYKADPNLIKEAIQILEDLAIKAAVGCIATGDSFMHDETRVKLVKEKFPEIIAAEMEAAAIAQVCYQYDTPFVMIRALSDIAGVESEVSFEEFLNVAAKHSTKFILNMLAKRNEKHG